MAKTVKRRPAKEITYEERLAANRRRAREENMAENAQDYVEAIWDLISERGEARVVDLARRLGLSHVTVVRTIARLQREDYVQTRPYRSIFLTEKGSRVAQESRFRHRVVVEFLRFLGVSEETAEADAEGIEHHVSEETLKAFQKLIGSRNER